MGLVVDHAVDLVKLSGFVIVTAEGSSRGLAAFDCVAGLEEEGGEVLA